MPKCKECSGSFGFMELKNGRCKQCINKETPPCLGCKQNIDKNELIDGYCRSCYAKEKQQ